MADGSERSKRNCGCIFRFSYNRNSNNITSTCNCDCGSRKRKQAWKRQAKFDFGSTSGDYNTFGISFGCGTGYLAGDPDNLIYVYTRTDGTNFDIVQNGKKMVKNEWYTINFTKAVLQSNCGWTSDEQIIKELTGQDYFMMFGGSTTVNAGNATNGFKATTVTYYLDEISYSVA